MIISTDAENVSDKIEHLLMIKTNLQKVGMGLSRWLRICLAIKGMWGSTPCGGTKSLHAIQHGQKEREKGGNKNIQIGQEGVKLSLFEEDIIAYVQNPKVSIEKSQNEKKYIEQVCKI